MTSHLSPRGVYGCLFVFFPRVAAADFSGFSTHWSWVFQLVSCVFHIQYYPYIYAAYHYNYFKCKMTESRDTFHSQFCNTVSSEENLTVKSAVWCLKGPHTERNCTNDSKRTLSNLLKLLVFGSLGLHSYNLLWNRMEDQWNCDDCGAPVRIDRRSSVAVVNNLYVTGGFH